ncbi:hypothetical protein M0R04_16025 [Candidatus Dojkabacteria bacterium]|nr:hypothetical protein [Candidatus Dojkabacteria bacterium]
MGILQSFKSLFGKEREEREEDQLIYKTPCHYNECAYHYQYGIPIYSLDVPVKHMIFPCTLLACLFCVRFDRNNDMFIKDKLRGKIPEGD